MSVHSKVEPPQHTDHRRVLMSGVLVTPAGNQRVTIRDISRTGAQVASRDQFTKDCDVMLKRGSLFAAARVTWVKGDEAGLKFYRELSAHEIEGTLPAALLRVDR